MQTSEENGKAARLEQTFVARPPPSALQTFANSGQPPYGQASAFAPRVIAPVPVVQPGAQPAFHVKLTATPIHNHGDKPLRYQVSAGPTATEDSATELITQGGKVISHCRPHVQANNSIQIRPTNADVLRNGFRQADGTLDGNIGAQVHAYPGTQGIGPGHLLNRLLDPASAAAANALSMQKLQDAKEGRLGRGTRSIPPHRVTENDMSRIEKTRLGKMMAKGKRLWPFSSSASGSKNHGDDVRSAMERQLDIGGVRRMTDAETDSVPPVPNDASPLERGYSRVMPSLLHNGDEQQPREFNWIVPAEQALVAEKIAGGEHKGGKVLNGGSSGLDVDDSPKLQFQGSSQLANFLEHPAPGLIYEGGQEMDAFGDSDLDSQEMAERENEMLRPTIVYGGIEHCSPSFAGRLSPLTFRLHSVETHQFLTMSGSEKPWFMENNLRPDKQALHGPVPLPFDPKNTGMPAPVFNTIPTHGQPEVTVAPLIRTFFEPELPVNYVLRGAAAEKTKTGQPIEAQADVGSESISSDSSEGQTSSESSLEPERNDSAASPPHDAPQRSASNRSLAGSPLQSDANSPEVIMKGALHNKSVDSIKSPTSVRKPRSPSALSSPKESMSQGGKSPQTPPATSLPQESGSLASASSPLKSQSPAKTTSPPKSSSPNRLGSSEKSGSPPSQSAGSPSSNLDQ